MIRVEDMTREGSALRLWPLVAVMLGSLVAGCTTNVVTGKSQLAPLMSASDEAAAGASAHPKIVAMYGGVYDDPGIGAYVANVTRRITRVTQAPDQPYRVTVLNSDIVNAFALPGGYVYVTRGLLALVDDEAELAGVLGHEIGHVIARHGAQRQTAALGASVIGAVLGAVVGNSMASQAVGLGSQGLIASYSRDQEYEADTLGVRYLAAAGYDPYAEGDFLAAMDVNARAEAIIAGKSDEVKGDWLASHPATPERVAAARREAQASGIARGVGERSRDQLFNAIDGMIYGSAPEQGFVRGQRFIHPVERFRFDAPSGFSIVNGPDEVTVLGPKKAVAKFDMAKKSATVGIDQYLSRVWAANVRLSPVVTFSVNGLKAARATTRIGDYDAMLVAIEAPQGKVYRFLMGVPQGSPPRIGDQLYSIAESFRLISAAEAAAVKPMRLRIVTVRAGDTMGTLAARMPFADFKLERFRALNGLPPDALLRVGVRVKTIVQ